MLKMKPKKTLTPAQRRAIILAIRASAQKRRGKITKRKRGTLKRRRGPEAIGKKKKTSKKRKKKK